MNKPPRLLAVDLDGTVVRRGGVVDDRDRRALAAIRARGVTVVVATGRLYSGARSVIDELGLQGTHVCADGAHVVRHPSGEDVAVRGLGSVMPLLRPVFEAGDLALFALARDRVIVDERSVNLNRYIGHIASEVEQTASVLAHASWDVEPGPSALVAIGPRAGVDPIEPMLREIDVDVLRYDVPGGFGVSSLAVHPRGASKGAALVELATELDIPLEQTVAVGDWLNDISMFERAGQSFAMAQAPEVVAALATHRLQAHGEDGGGIAELARLVWGIEV